MCKSSTPHAPHAALVAPQEITPEALAALSARPTTDVVEGSDGEDEAEPDLGSNASSSDDEGSEAAGAAAAQGAEEAAGGNEAAAAAGAEGSGGGSSAAAAGGAGEEDEGEGKGGQGPGAGEEEEEEAAGGRALLGLGFGWHWLGCAALVWAGLWEALCGGGCRWASRGGTSHALAMLWCTACAAWRDGRGPRLSQAVRG